MEKFDGEVERVVTKAGRAAFWLTVMAVATLVFGALGGVGIGLGDGDEAGAGAGVFLGSLAAAALLYGIGMVVNLLGMQLMEMWRQGRRSAENTGSDD